ncbi:unnamed protein product [Gadus morhua 'NCC']
MLDKYNFLAYTNKLAPTVFQGRDQPITADPHVTPPWHRPFEQVVSICSGRAQGTAMWGRIVTSAHQGKAAPTAREQIARRKLQRPEREAICPGPYRAGSLGPDHMVARVVSPQPSTRQEQERHT